MTQPTGEQLSRTECRFDCGAGECMLRQLGVVTGVAAELIPEDDARAQDVLGAHALLAGLCRDYAVNDALVILEDE